MGKEARGVGAVDDAVIVGKVERRHRHRLERFAVPDRTISVRVMPRMATSGGFTIG
jgi:hypothetical protein